MKVAIYTVDLYPGRERLMPWRTLIEVAKVMTDNNFQVEILTASVERENKDYTYQSIEIKSVPRNFNALATFINKNEYDALYFPVTWRDGFKNLSVLKSITCEKIAYFPGGVYALTNVLALNKWGGIKPCKPYLLECLASKKRLIRKLDKVGFSNAIGLSPATTQAAHSAGFNNAITILPGKDSFEYLNHNIEILENFGLNDKKFYLFTGAPAVTRGSQCLLKAFDLLAEKRVGQITVIKRERTSLPLPYG